MSDQDWNDRRDHGVVGAAQTAVDLNRNDPSKDPNRRDPNQPDVSRPGANDANRRDEPGLLNRNDPSSEAVDQRRGDLSKTYNDPRRVNPSQPGQKINPPFGAKEAVVDADDRINRHVNQSQVDDEALVARGTMSRFEADQRHRDRLGHFGRDNAPLFDSQNVNHQIDVIRQHLRALYGHTGPVPSPLAIQNDMNWPAIEQKRISDAEEVARRAEEVRARTRGNLRPYAERDALGRDSIVDGTRARDPSYHGGSPRALVEGERVFDPETDKNI